MLGGAVGVLDHHVFGHTELGSFALVGMGALFAGVIRAPITSVLIIFEMTGGYGLVLPLMIANTTAYVVSRRFDPESLYDALLEQDGIRLPTDPESTPLLEKLTVEQAMTKAVEVLADDTRVCDTLSMMERHPFSMYPVLDAQRRCLGLISVARARRVVAEGASETPIRQLVRLREYVYPEDPLIRAVVRMNALGTRHLPVVTHGAHTFCGLLTMSDIFREQALAAKDAEHTDAARTTHPPEPITDTSVAAVVSPQQPGTPPAPQPPSTPISGATEKPVPPSS
jgi:CIC family chloride channel protein